jgi:hypothetical protein
MFNLLIFKYETKELTLGHFIIFAPRIDGMKKKKNMEKGNPHLPIIPIFLGEKMLDICIHRFLMWEM